MSLVLLLISSYYFYMCWKPQYIILILISTAIDYFASLKMEKYREEKGKRRLFLLLSLCSNLGLLFFFKYTNFFGDILNRLFGLASLPVAVPHFDILLPVGISFYTFQTMSYSIDVYRGKIKAERHFGYFALFVSFFPQLVAGPIEKPENLLPQLHQEHPFSYENATYGLKLMTIGFFKKVVVADNIAPLVNQVYNNVQSYSGGILVLATILFAFQIYCDFGGYSDIARGAAKTMGIDLMVNFKSPYFFSHSIKEYWTRNHISLSQWFTSYVYIPLGGSRCAVRRKYIHIFLTFFLSGLWHGANYTFVVWGVLQGLYLIVEDFISRHKSPGFRARLPILQIIVTFSLSCFSLIFFRANSLGDAGYIIREMLSGLSAPVTYVKDTAWACLGIIGTYNALLLAMHLLLLFCIDLTDEKTDVVRYISTKPVLIRWSVYILFLLYIIMFLPKNAPAEFIYFQF